MYDNIQTVFERGVPFWDIRPDGYWTESPDADAEVDPYACCLSLVVTLRRGSKLAPIDRSHDGTRCTDYKPPAPITPIMGEIFLTTYVGGEKDRRIVLAPGSKDRVQDCFNVKSQKEGTRFRFYRFFYDRFLEGISPENGKFRAPQSKLTALLDEAKTSLDTEGILERFTCTHESRYPFANGCVVTVAARPQGSWDKEYILLALISRDEMNADVPVLVRFFYRDWSHPETGWFRSDNLSRAERQRFELED